MKKYLYSLIMGLALISCSDFTDVQPKGKNLLSSADQLEMLLNTEISITPTEAREIAGDIIYSYSNVPSEINLPNKTASAIRWTWDENNMDKWADQVNTDNEFTTCYNCIGRVANPILMLVDEAEGDEQLKKRIKCEAYVMRAYCHYLLVNKFARAYTINNASTTPAIPYLLETQNLEQPMEKKTLEEVYDHILSDVNKAIEIDALPIEATNRMRFNKPSAYAIKALTLMNMQRFDEAEDAAKQALTLNGHIDNYNEMLTTVTGSVKMEKHQVILRPKLECKEDLFFTYNVELRNSINPEVWNALEQGHACRDKMTTDVLMSDYTRGDLSSSTGLPYVMTQDMNSCWNAGGIKTTYLYLIVAENEIRKGNINTAMEQLDKIRQNRIDTSVYQPLKGTVNNKADAIRRLKQTALGENLYSFYGFIFKKRWNQLDDYKQSYSREIDGKVYSISPDSKMWIFPFPKNSMNNNSKLTQNYK